MRVGLSIRGRREGETTVDGDNVLFSGMYLEGPSFLSPNHILIFFVLCKDSKILDNI